VIERVTPDRAELRAGDLDGRRRDRQSQTGQADRGCAPLPVVPQPRRERGAEQGERRCVERDDRPVRDRGSSHDGKPGREDGRRDQPGGGR
jgi:hypothetical protein